MPSGWQAPDRWYEHVTFTMSSETTTMESPIDSDKPLNFMFAVFIVMLLQIDDELGTVTVFDIVPCQCQWMPHPLLLPVCLPQVWHPEP